MQEPIIEEVLKEIQATICYLETASRYHLALAVAACVSTVECLQNAALRVLFESVEIGEPLTFRQAINSPQRCEWNGAMDDEMLSLEENGTWKVIPRLLVPRTARILRGKWVYKLKRGLGGTIQRYKARWVVRGFEQRYGIDFNKTFAAVVKPMTYKALFALAAMNNWEIEQMDVKTAFLYGEIDEEVYVEMPDGYCKEGSVCKLTKALYGLKRAPRIWYNTLSTFLESLGFRRLHEDLVSSLTIMERSLQYTWTTCRLLDRTSKQLTA